MKNKILNFLLLSILFSLFLFINMKNYATTVSNNLENNIFRLHIIANSNSTQDQDLKLKIRDVVIEYINKTQENLNSKQEIINNITYNLPTIQKLVEETIKKYNFDYNVSVEIGNFYFPTKHYGNISLPAGMYGSIKIKIGSANGENWWCSLFPPLCFTNISTGIIDETTKNDLKETLENEEFSIITNTSSKYKFKFKLIELLNQ